MKRQATRHRGQKLSAIEVSFALANCQSLPFERFPHVSRSYGTEILCYSRATGERSPKERHNAALAAASLEELNRLLGILDTHLEKRSTILGGAFSLVDLAVASTVNYGSLCGISTDVFAHVTRWLVAFRARPAFASAWAAAPKTH